MASVADTTALRGSSHNGGAASSQAAYQQHRAKRISNKARQKKIVMAAKIESGGVKIISVSSNTAATALHGDGVAAKKMVAYQQHIWRMTAGNIMRSIMAAIMA